MTHSIADEALRQLILDLSRFLVAEDEEVTVDVCVGDETKNLDSPRSCDKRGEYHRQTGANRCTRCGLSYHVRRSRLRFYDIPAVLVLLRPYRCRNCVKRFYAHGFGQYVGRHMRYCKSASVDTALDWVTEVESATPSARSRWLQRPIPISA